MKKLNDIGICAAVLLSVVLNASAAENKWQAPSSGGDWSTVGNWSLDRLPSTDNGDNATFPVGTAGNINLDGAYSIYNFLFYSSNDHSATNPVATKTFVGTGSLTASATAEIYNGIRVVLNGPTLNLTALNVGYSHFLVQSGVLNTSGTLQIKDNAKGGIFEMQGGTVSLNKLMSYGREVRLSGGTLTVATDLNFYKWQSGTQKATLSGTDITTASLSIDSADVEQTGGSVRTTGRLALGGNFTVDGDDASLYVGADIEKKSASIGGKFTLKRGSLDVVTRFTDGGATNVSYLQQGGTARINAFNFPASAQPSVYNGYFRQEGGTLFVGSNFAPLNSETVDGQSAYIGGTVVVTNGTSYFYVKGNDASVEGGGRVYCNAFWLATRNGTSGSMKKTTIDLSEIYIGGGSGGLYDVYGYCDYYFPRKTTFGAFADWKKNGGVTQCNLHFQKGLVVDTDDCFDGTTGRTVEISDIDVAPGQCVEVRGGGTAVLGFLGSVADIDIDVKAGATLELKTPVRVRKLKVAAGGHVVLRMNESRLDVIDESEVAPTATFVANVPSSATTGRWWIYGCGGSDGGEGSVASRITLSDSTGRWTLVRVGGVVYGITADKQVSPTSATYWTGAQNGSFYDSDNWYGGSVPYGSSPAYFMATPPACTVVTNDYKANTGSDYYIVRWRYDNAPYLMTGGSVRFTGLDTGNNAAVYVAGHPVVMDLDVTHNGSLFCCNEVGDAFVQFNGNVTAATKFVEKGDVRVSGALTAPNFDFNMASGANAYRGNVLSVLNGGTIELNAVASPLTNGSFRVYEGGTLYVKSGTISWCEPTTCLLYGTFKTAAAFGGDYDLTLSGDGELLLTGDALTSRGTRLPKFEGDLVLGFDGDADLGTWTVSEGSSLTIDPHGHVVTFSEYPEMDGALKVKAGAAIRPSGALAESAELDWTRLADEGDVDASFEAALVKARYLVRHEDGGVWFKRNILGMFLLIK